MNWVKVSRAILTHPYLKVSQVVHWTQIMVILECYPYGMQYLDVANRLGLFHLKGYGRGEDFFLQTLPPPFYIF